MKIKKYIEEIKTKDGNVRFSAYVKIQIKPILFVFPNYHRYNLCEFRYNCYLSRYGGQSRFTTYYHAVESLNKEIDKFIKDHNSSTITNKTKRRIV